MKSIKRYAIALATAAMSLASANAVGWPANYEGVMFQAFGWDTYTDTKWTNLESQADELSQYFKLIWIPNSGFSGGHNNMGYMPQYWFTNHNSSFGTEEELLSMISTFKAKGTGFIADVVINHRNGASNWTDFPKEEWNGRTWQIGPEGICSTDEVRNATGQATPTGAPDTGDDFDGARDLDHTNANVQDNCKNYCKCLLEKYGYTGFRYDMVKGYSGQYNKIYNQYSKPTFSVGEYWDGSYDAVKAWIEATGRESAAFDFPGKYAINEAFSSGDMTKLVWKANGTTNQPAGMIHFGYPQLAVTFVDNHDTYRDGSKFTGNIPAANAFILCSPGTPCVFLPHWQQHKAAIKALIDARNSVGVSNTSTVTVLKSTSNCYMAEVKGSKGKLVVKIGPAKDSPSGYTTSDIKASGNDYCVWTKVNGGGDDPVTETQYCYFINSSDWTAPAVWAWNADNGDENCNANGTWPGDPMTEKDGKYYWEAPKGKKPTHIIISDNGDTKAGGGDLLFVNGATYKPDGTIENGDDPIIPQLQVNIYFDNSNSNWTTPHIHYWGGSSSAWPGVAMTNEDGNIWKYTCPGGTTGILFNAGDGDATKTGDFVAINNHVYDTSGDQGEYQGGDNPPIPVLPDKIYMVGTLNNATWATANGLKPDESNDGLYTWNSVKLNRASATEPIAYFTFITALDNADGEWEAANQSDRYGAVNEGDEITLGTPANVMTYRKGVNASSAKSWSVQPGTYKTLLNLKDKTVTLTDATSGVEIVILPDTAAPAEYYNLQGVKVANPDNGLYIIRRGNKVTKEYIVK